MEQQRLKEEEEAQEQLLEHLEPEENQGDEMEELTQMTGVHRLNQTQQFAKLNESKLLEAVSQMQNKPLHVAPVPGQGRIITENEEKLRLALLENDALEKLYNQKQIEQEKINFKYQKAQSEFLEIMRELSRFRGEFLDNYSLRSKLLHTLSI